MDGTRKYHDKQSKSVSDRQIPHDFIHMLNLRNKQREKEREAIQNTSLNCRQQIDGYQRGGGWGDGLNK